MNEEKTEALAAVELFRELGHDALRKIAGICRHKTAGKGETIFWTGDEGRNMYVIREGTVKVFDTDPDGKTRTLRLLGPGEVLGEMALFDAGPRSASAQCLTDCLLFELSKDEFTGLLREMPEIAIRLLAVLAGRIRRMNRQVEALSFLGVPERLAITLRQLAAEQGKPASGGWLKIPLPLTHEELGQLVGSSRETVTRALKELEKEGWVKHKGRTIYVKAQTASPQAEIC